MNKLFSSVKAGKPRRNVFDLSHEKKLSMNPGTLVPVLCCESLPGDKFRVTTEQIIRMAPMVAPVMHRVNVYMHYFFVPNRLVWDNWQTFITGGVDGKQAPLIPKLGINDVTKIHFGLGSLADYLGINPVLTTESVTNGWSINALPFRAYQQIWNDYYMDQNLQQPVGVLKTDGTITDPEMTAICTLRKRNYEKDYFVSSLPWTQRGDDVNIPIDPVYKLPAKAYIAGGTGAQGAMSASAGDIQSNSINVEIDNIESLGSTINDLRTSIRLQEWLEKNARAGSRYIEQILAHFGVRTPDYRLQRSEYLGGGKVPIQISEVLANFGSDTIPQGNMAGHGLGVGNASGFTYSCYEHGYIFGIMSIMPKAGYMTGIHRMFRKDSKFDWAFPEFANLGEQPVWSHELAHAWADPQAPTVANVFGYQSRFAEYKYFPSTVHGEMRTDLDHWHWDRKFASVPQLNESFIQCNPDERIFAVDDLGASHKFYVQLYNNVKAIRPLPVYGTPML